jgi:hypothetical protein
MATGRTVSAGAARRSRQVVDDLEPGVLDALDHQLRDSVAAGQLHGILPIVVDHNEFDLTPVAGVDRSRRIHQPYAAAGGQAGPWMYESGEPLRQRDGHTGRDDRACPRRQLNVDRGHQVGARVAGLGVRRWRKIGI